MQPVMLAFKLRTTDLAKMPPAAICTKRAELAPVTLIYGDNDWSRLNERERTTVR